MLYAEVGDDLVNGGIAAGRAAAEDYRANRYHAPADEYDPNWNWSGAIRDLELYYQIGRELAETEEWPNWYEDAEFRAIRDKSRAGAESRVSPSAGGWGGACINDLPTAARMGAP